MDTQIWYSVFCTIVGGIYGVLHHLGEVIYVFFITSFSVFSLRNEMVHSSLSLKIDKDTRNAKK